jgi:hypothetical protein
LFTSFLINLYVDPSAPVNFDAIAFTMNVMAESVKNLNATDTVGSIVWAFPTLCVISNDDLDEWKYCRGIIKSKDLTGGKIKIAFFVGPVPIKRAVISNLLDRRYTGQDNSNHIQGQNEKNFSSVLRSLWFFRQLFILMKLPKNANFPELDQWLRSKQKQHESKGALSLNV